MADLPSAFTDELGGEIGPGRFACIEVKDTGSGIGPETKAKIFDPFFTSKFVGRGLGLAAIAGILRSQKLADAINDMFKKFPPQPKG